MVSLTTRSPSNILTLRSLLSPPNPHFRVTSHNRCNSYPGEPYFSGEKSLKYGSFGWLLRWRPYWSPDSALAPRRRTSKFTTEYSCEHKHLPTLPNLSFNYKLQLVCAVLLLLAAYSLCPSNSVVINLTVLGNYLIMELT